MPQIHVDAVLVTGRDARRAEAPSREGPAATAAAHPRRARRGAVAPYALLLAAAIAAPSSAADRTWVGAIGIPPGDGTTYASPLNWSPNLVPGVNDTALFDAVGGTIFFPGGAVTNDRLLVVGPAPLVTFDLNGGVYLLANVLDSGADRGLIVGLDAGDIAALSVQNGTLVGTSAAIAVDSASVGSIELGSGVVWSLSEALHVGEWGFATLTSAGTVISGPATVGALLTGNGTVVIDSTGGLWLCLGPLVAASEGMADVSVLNGGKLIATEGVALATMLGSSATLLVRDAGSLVLVEGGMVIGGESGVDGGSALVTLDNGGLLRVAPSIELRVGGTLDIVFARVETPEVLVDGGESVVNVGGTLVVSGAGTTEDPGVFVAIGGGEGLLRVRNGGTLISSHCVVAPTPTAPGDVEVTGTDTSAIFSGSVSLGSSPIELERNGAKATLLVGDAATLDADGTLFVGQRGVLRLEGGTATASFADFAAESTTSIDFDSPALGVDAAVQASVAGGLLVQPAAVLPLVGTTFDVVQAPFLFGSFAVVGSSKLGSNRFVQVSTVSEAGMDIIRAEVALLPVQLIFATPGATDLDAPPSDVGVGQLDSDDPLPQAVITVPGADPEAAGTLQLLANTAPPGTQPVFDVVAAVPVGSNPQDLALGALFNSGPQPMGPPPDVAVSNRNGNSITLVRNAITPASADALGGSIVVDEELAVGGQPGGLAIADLDGDGTPEDPDNDIAVAVQGPTLESLGYVAVFFNQNGNFGPGFLPVQAGANPQTVCPIDTTGDKLLDLVVANFGRPEPELPIDGPSVTMHVNLGNGFFCEPRVYEVGEGPVALAMSDFNDDGLVDVVTANSVAGTISVLSGNPASGPIFLCTQVDPFLPAVDLDAGGLPVAMAAAAYDFLDGEESSDEDVDIAVMVKDPDDGAITLSVFRNDSSDGQIVFTLLANVQSVIGIPAALAGADTDGDGTPDLVSVGENGGAPATFAGAGNGFISVSVSVPSCPGDLAGDGDVDGGDLGLVLAAWGAMGPNIPEDLNGDGIVDAADIGLLLNNWGMCGLAG